MGGGDGGWKGEVERSGGVEGWDLVSQEERF